MALEAQALFDIRQTLSKSTTVRHVTYERPTKNMDEIPSLRPRGICSVQTTGSGRTRRNTSVTTLPTPCITTRLRVCEHLGETKAARKSRCEEPVGEHMTANAMHVDRCQSEMTTIPVMETTRIHCRTLKS